MPALFPGFIGVLLLEASRLLRAYGRQFEAESDNVAKDLAQNGVVAGR